MSLIHIARNNVVLGQFTEEDVRNGLANGTYLPADLAWRAGLSQWKPLGEWPEFAAPGSQPPPVSFEETNPPVVMPAWERRKNLGFFSALVATTKEVLLAPQTTFAYMVKTGGFKNPLLFYITPQAILGLLVSLGMSLFFGVMMNELDKTSGGGANPLHDVMASLGAGGLAALYLVVFAVWIPLAIFLGAGVLHILLKIWGACNAPYETTFRVVAYTWGASAWVMLPLQVLSFIPCLGLIFSMVAMAVSVWFLIIQIIGLAKAHEAQTGRVVGAVLTPVLLCCCLYGLGVAFFVASVAAQPTTSTHTIHSTHGASHP